MNTNTIVCSPRWFSRTYDISNFDCEATGRFSFWTEQGSLEIDGIKYEIKKHGPLSGRWSMHGPNGIVATAKLEFGLKYSFRIDSNMGVVTLKSSGWFSRSMLLKGAGFNAIVRPAFLTRKLTIDGEIPDDEIASFAFWLTGLAQQRRRRSTS